jgi:RNA polymerase sigma-70 factor (ECF subfamily)
MQAASVSSAIHFVGQEREASELDDIEQLVHRYRARLLRFVVFSIGDQDLAESIVQDSFMRAYNARATFRRECSVHTWLNRIALNLIRDSQRTKKFRFWSGVRKTAMEITEVASTLPSGAGTPEKNLLMRERIAQVAEAMQELSFNQRTVFLMRFQEGMGIKEISLATDISANTVKTHLYRAIKVVRDKIGDSK